MIVGLLSRRELNQVRKAITQVKEEQLQDYLAEVERCLKASALRAAIVLSWSAIVYHLRRTAELVGFNNFRQKAVELANRRRLKLKPEEARGFSVEDLRKGKISDRDLLQICYEMGIIGEAERKRLAGFLELRNDCAHPGKVDVSSGDVVTLVEYAIKAGPFGGWYLPAAFFERILSNPDYTIDSRRARGLIGLLPETEHLALIGKLLSLHYDPSQLLELLIDPDDPEKAVKRAGLEAKLVESVGNKVPVLWEALAGRLDDQKKIQAHCKLADVLIRASSPERVWWRDFVFWDQLNGTPVKMRQVIVNHLVSEYGSVVNSDQWNPALDLPRLELLARSVENQDREDYLKLLEGARRWSTAS